MFTALGLYPLNDDQAWWDTKNSPHLCYFYEVRRYHEN